MNQRKVELRFSLLQKFKSISTYSLGGRNAAANLFQHSLLHDLGKRLGINRQDLGSVSLMPLNDGRPINYVFPRISTGVSLPSKTSMGRPGFPTSLKEKS